MAGAQRFLHDVDTLIRARYPLLYLVTWEEQRVEAMLGDVARSHGKDLLEWSSTRGLRYLTGRGQTFEGSEQPDKALEAIGTLSEPSLVLLKDFHRCFSDPRTVRGLRELGFKLKTAFTTLIITAPVLEIPPELEKEVTVIDVPLPTRDELMQLLRDITRVVVKNKRAVVELNNAQAEALVSAALGLTLTEAENAFARSIAEDNRLDGNDVRRMLEEKSQVVRKSGLLEYQTVDTSLGDIGGLAGLKRWLERRQNAFSNAARAFGLPEPKGVLLLGVQGCGKSLTAKAIASGWRLPLLRLDMGRIFSGLVGSSEENVRRAIRIAESLAPVVLWVDEIEKGLAGTQGQGDSGVSGARLRLAPHVDAGKDGAGLRGRDGEPHRGAAARAAAQGPLRRDFLRRPADGGRSRVHLRHSAEEARPRPGEVFTPRVGPEERVVLGRRDRAGHHLGDV